MRHYLHILTAILALWFSVVPATTAAEGTDDGEFAVTVTRRGVVLVNGNMSGAGLLTTMTTYGNDDACIINIDLVNKPNVYLCESPERACLSIGGANVTLNLRHRMLHGNGEMFSVANGSLSIMDELPSDDEGQTLSSQKGNINNHDTNSTTATIKVSSSGTLIFNGGIMDKANRGGSRFDVTATDNAHLFITSGTFYQGIEVTSTDVSGRISGGGFNAYDGQIPIGTLVREGYGFYKGEASGAAVDNDISRETSVFSKSAGGLVWIQGNDATADVLTLDAAQAASFTGYEPRRYKSVVFNRTFASEDKWYSFHVPFASVPADWKGLEFYRYESFHNMDSADGVITVAKLEDQEQMDANRPYYVIAKDNSLTSWTFTDKEVKMAMPTATDCSGYTFVCNYGTIDQQALNDPAAHYYYINDGRFWRYSEVSKPIPPTRWFFYTKDDEKKAKGVTFMLAESMQTAMPAVVIQRVSPGVYSLDGRRIADASRLQKGIYIVEGKKIITK